MPDWTKYVRERLPLDRIRGGLETEILEELATHLEDTYQEARNKGATPAEAEARAMAEVGDWEELAARIVRTRQGAGSSRAAEELEAAEERMRLKGGGWAPLADAMQELRFTLRRLRKAPGFSLVVLLTLAIGIGATTAIFSVVKGVLLDPLPFDEPEQLVGIWNAAPGMGEDQLPQSLAANAVYEDDARALQDVGVWTLTRTSIRGPEGPEDILGMRVTQGIFAALRVQPTLGRSFTFEDTQTQSSLTIILAHNYWRDVFDEDPGVLGRTVEVGGYQREIIGVMPAGFRFMDRDPHSTFPLDTIRQASRSRTSCTRALDAWPLVFQWRRPSRTSTDFCCWAPSVIRER